MKVENIEHKIDVAGIPQEVIKRCYKHSIKLLSIKDFSKHKLKTKLLEKDFPPRLVNELVVLLEEEKYLREDYYKEGRIKGLMNKGYHPSMISQKMFQEKCPVTDEEIFQIMDEYELDEKSMLVDLIHKKIRIMDAIGTTDNSKKWDKVMRYVTGKGHSFTRAKSILDGINFDD